MENDWTKRIEDLEAENARLARDNKVCVELNDKLVAEIARIEDRVSEEYEAERADDREKIEELKKENEALREALQAIATGDRSAHEAMLWARQALREASHE